MYDKITILADTGFIINHLSMNGYNFEAIGQNLYVLKDETDYVMEILKENHIRFRVNDKSYQMNTERGLVCVAEWFKDTDAAKEKGYHYAFKAHNDNVTLFSKCLDTEGHYHAFAIVG